MKPVSRARQNAGFTIPEAIGYVLVFTLIMGALTALLSSLFSSQAHPQVVYSSQTYELAPSYTNLRQAIDLHAALANAIDQADSVVLLGGSRSHPSLDPTGPSSALLASYVPTTLAAMSGGDGFTAFSSWDQRQLNSTQFAGNLTTGQDAADCTVLTVQGLTRITSITQQRRYTTTANGQSVVLYEVTHQTVDWTSGSAVLTVNATTGTTPTYFYRCYYRAAEDTWAQPPGISHYWYRADSTWNRDQEGPAKIVFADPYIVAGDDSTAQINSVSRFIYFVTHAQ